MYEGKMMS